MCMRVLEVKLGSRLDFPWTPSCQRRLFLLQWKLATCSTAAWQVEVGSPRREVDKLNPSKMDGTRCRYVKSPFSNCGRG